MKTKILMSLLVCFIGLSKLSSSQNLLFSEEVTVDSIKGNFGPNLKHHIQPMIEFGIIFPNINVPAYEQKFFSPSYGFGLKYKYRFCNTFSLGMAVNYQINTRNYKYFSYLALLPDSITSNNFRSYKLTQQSISFRPFIRFNIGRRGNNLGKYLELGGFYNHFIFSKETIKFNDFQGLKTTRITNFQKVLSYKYAFGLNASIGYKNYSLFARLEYWNDPLANSVQQGPTTIGLQLGF